MKAIKSRLPFIALIIVGVLVPALTGTNSPAFLTLPLDAYPAVGTGWFYDNGSDHHAIDYPAPIGTSVRAADAGWAIASCQPEKYGTFILIQHDSGYSTIYAHLGHRDANNIWHTGVLLGSNAILPIDEPCPQDISGIGARHSIGGSNSIGFNGHQYQRQRVQRGEIIGEVGVTGNTTGPHLHFEVSLNPDGSYSSHQSGKLDPYDIDKKSPFYPPPSDRCANIKSPAQYLWTSCSPMASVGTISVATNQSAATFTLTGPLVFTGGGGSFAEPAAPAGSYTINYGPVPGFDTPPSETKALSAGGSIFFSGTYTLTPPILSPPSELDWLLKNPVNSPTPRSRHAIASDWGGTGSPMMFGGWSGFGYQNDTWVWAGNDWVSRSPADSPSPRGDHAMASNVVPSEILLFGGDDGAYPNLRFFSDTWIWNGTNWTRRGPAHSPTPRGNSAMAYDSVHRQVVLFGGYDGSYRRDTWIWDGTDWTPMPTLHHPTGGVGAAMVFDSVRSQLLLFGGYDGTSYVNETWIWNGTDWTQLSPATSPPPRAAHAMASDLVRGRILVFGGYGDSGSSFRNDTWVWDGATWKLTSPIHSPSPRISSAFGFDLPSKELVLFGGNDFGSATTYRNDTWVWPGDAPVLTGMISVATNRGAATFTLNGPSAFSGSGTSFVVSAAPAGSYAIVYGSISGFDTPPSETKALSAGGSIVFTGTYLPLVPPGSPQFTVRDLGTLGGSFSLARAVNDAGMVVGDSSLFSNSATHAFAWTLPSGMTDLGTLGVASSATAVSRNGTVIGNNVFDFGDTDRAFVWTQAGGMIDLGTLGGSSSHALGVNDSGMVVGESRTPNGEEHGFVWTQATGMVELTLGGTFSRAWTVNSSGLVAGQSHLPGDVVSHAFVWTQAGGMVDIGTLGGSFGESRGINDLGVVVGYSSLAGDSDLHAFAWTEAAGMTDLGTFLGGVSSVPAAVNQSGMVVGQGQVLVQGLRASHPFVWTNAGGMVDLGTLGALQGFAVDVNDGGTVVGLNSDENGDEHAFVWTQVGGMIDLGSGRALAVNVGGLIVGGSWAPGTSMAQSHATVWVRFGGTP